MVNRKSLNRIKPFKLSSTEGTKITGNIRIENSIHSSVFQIVKKRRYFNHYLNKRIENEVLS